METKGKKMTQTFEASKTARSSLTVLQIPVFRYNWQFYRNWGYEKNARDFYTCNIEKIKAIIST